MGRTAYTVLLHTLNGVLVVLGLALAAASIWFFRQLHELTALRNSNHYLLDYNLYWPQAVPWMFLVVSAAVVCAAPCGFTGARRRSRGLLNAYAASASCGALLALAAAALALALAAGRAADDFVKDTVWDVYFQTKSDSAAAASFGDVERRLRCCGADSPRDYKNWRTEFPMSCCEVHHRGYLDPHTVDCQFTSKLANERYGCSAVAAQYANVAIMAMSGGALLAAPLALAAAALAVALRRALGGGPPAPVARYESESKKVLL